MVSEYDNGIYDGLNRALERVTAKFVCVLHTNDIFASNNILEMAALSLKSNFHLAYGDVLFYSRGDPNHIVRHWVSGNFKKNKLFLGWMPPHTTLFVKKEIFESFEIVYRTDLKVSADYDFILRLLKSDEIKINYFNKPIVKMSVEGISTSGFKSLNN